MKKKGTIFLALSLVATLFAISVSELNTMKVLAKTAVVPETEISEENTMQTVPAKRLKKAGYVFQLTKTATLYPKFTENMDKPYDKKFVKKLIDKKVLFKVTEFGTARTCLLAHIVDKSGKYQGWVSLMSEDISNINANKKAFKPLVKAELRACNLAFDKGKKAAMKAMSQVQTEVKKLHGKNKKIGLTSVKQVKKWIAYGGRDEAYQYIPSLVFGKF